MNPGQCKDCVAYHQPMTPTVAAAASVGEPVAVGECRFNPPTLVAQQVKVTMALQQDMSYSSQYPPTPAAGWCYQFEAAVVDAEDDGFGLFRERDKRLSNELAGRFNEFIVNNSRVHNFVASHISAAMIRDGQAGVLSYGQDEGEANELLSLYRQWLRKEHGDRFYELEDNLDGDLDAIRDALFLFAVTP